MMLLTAAWKRISLMTDGKGLTITRHVSRLPSAPTVWAAVFQYMVGKQEKNTVHHEIFKEKQIYVQFIVHPLPSLPSVTIRDLLYSLYLLEICQIMTERTKYISTGLFRAYQYHTKKLRVNIVHTEFFIHIIL